MALIKGEGLGEHSRPTTDDESPDIRRMINGASLDDRPPPLENNGELDATQEANALRQADGEQRTKGRWARAQGRVAGWVRGDKRVP